MPTYDVTLYVDGMVYVTVEAANEDEAASEATKRVGVGDYVEVEAVSAVVDAVENAD